MNLSTLVFLGILSMSSFAQAEADDITAKPESNSQSSSLSCPSYKVYYIDPSAQFFTPPVPIEDHAEFVFCSDHANLDEVRVKLKKLKPVRGQADAETARIKIVPRGKPDEAMIFCSTGEITYRGKQYRLDRRAYEPSLLALREEGDRQRAMAIERDSELEPRNPASEKPESSAKPTK